MVADAKLIHRGDIFCPNSDGERLWYIPLDDYAGYAESLPDQPGPEDWQRIDRQRSVLDECRGGGM